MSPDVLKREEAAVEQSQTVPEGGTARVVPTNAFEDVAFDRDFTGSASYGVGSPYFSQLENLNDMVSICTPYAPEPVEHRVLYVRINVEPHLTFDFSAIEYPEQPPLGVQRVAHLRRALASVVAEDDAVYVVEDPRQAAESALQLDLAEVAAQMRDFVDLPVQDLARMAGLGRRQYYNLMRGKAASMKTSDDEKRFRLLHRFLGRLQKQLGDARTVRGVVLQPLGNFELRSFFDVAVGGDLSEMASAYDFLAEGLQDAVPANRLPPSATVAADDPRWDDVSAFLHEQRATGE
jgi:hypothetical protein